MYIQLSKLRFGCNEDADIGYKAAEPVLRVEDITLATVIVWNLESPARQRRAILHDRLTGEAPLNAFCSSGHLVVGSVTE